MSSKHHILFDLDGTLTDSFKGIVHSVRHIIPSYSLKTKNLQRLSA